MDSVPYSRIKIRLSAVFIYILLIVLFLSVSSYLVLFSPYTARFSPIIDFRNSYINKVSSLEKELGFKAKDYCAYTLQPIQTIRTATEPGYKYYYSLTGELINVDISTKTITLKCSNASRYVLSINLYSSEFPGWVYTDYGLIKNINGNTRFYFYPGDLTKKAAQNPYNDNDQIFSFIWIDKRELADIYMEIKNYPNTPVNSTNFIPVGLLKLND